MDLQLLEGAAKYDALSYKDFGTFLQQTIGVLHF